MQARKRYFLLIFFFMLGGFARFIFLIITNNLRQEFRIEPLKAPKISESSSYLDFEDLLADETYNLSDSNEIRSVFNPKSCTISSCFNFSRCEKSFKIHIYPDNPNYPLDGSESGKVSEVYGKILKALTDSIFYTPNPDEACLFVLSFDTLDRDVLSGDYVKNLRAKINNLPENLWNGGKCRKRPSFKRKKRRTDFFYHKPIFPYEC